jgi:hypothetical protein
MLQQAIHHFSNLEYISAKPIVRLLRQVSQVTAKEKQVFEFRSRSPCFVKAGGEFSVSISATALGDASRN